MAVKAKKKAVKAVKKVRCLGKTAEGKQCKRKVDSPGKYCYLHKK